MMLERLTFEYESLCKVENDQKLTIEKLSNNESWKIRLITLLNLKLK